jgi:hypothetical protein
MITEALGANGYRIRATGYRRQTTVTGDGATGNRRQATAKTGDRRPHRQQEDRELVAADRCGKGTWTLAV